ncbi:uncharacterized protein LOC110458215 isoform X2 [Mizuhopecten yessoensis]|uniref:uncharacterized protein LOC110458215 isoform X2 n=1 Tax=Mizuhopecten yessoensis TaxID=6573 RepID=UPI000B45B9ED|nr:uncharacterized protein LOC110458215 isoform X2 [Mizuhopecten yessoensis]
MLLPTGEMGCGRSKHHSRDDSMTDLDSDPKAKRNKVSKDKKKTSKKKGPPEVTIDRPVATVGGKRGQEVESGVLKSRRPTPAHNNGTVLQTLQTEIKVTVNEEKVIPNEMTRGSFGTKEKTGDGQNQFIRVTNSQIEFFKMLDEKIEQGQEFTSEEDVSQTSDQATTDNFRKYTQ